MTSTSNPWRDIQPPFSSSVISTRRVDPYLEWDCFWGRDVNSRYLFVMGHGKESAPVEKLPTLSGLTSTLSPIGNTERQNFILTLQDDSQGDLFYALCMDLVECARSQENEADAVRQVVARAWRWHHLLRSGRSGLLTADEQKGLIAELHVLSVFLFDAIGVSDAIESWTGPSGAPKDFDVGGVPLEVKARRGSAAPFIAISSEHQLDMPDGQSMYLYVGDYARATDFNDESFSLSDAVREVRDEVATREPSALFAFAQKLNGTGYRDEDSYVDYPWVAGKSRWFAVQDGFPRLRAGECSEGVSEVRYRIALNSCTDFEVDVAAVQQAIGVDVDDR